ncbi:MAG: hypothetical protein JXR15_12640 [Shimia sp.]|uniref:hypothetical protein n=1 Tax=Shimia sp. TaxID=1954381 RepID=UPI003B8E7D50
MMNQAISACKTFLFLATLLFAAPAAAQNYDLEVKPASGSKIEKGKQYWVSIKCTSGRRKILSRSNNYTFNTPKAYLQSINSKGEFTPSRRGISAAKSASLWISIGSENLDITNGVPSIKAEDAGAGKGLDSVFMPVFIFGLGAGADYIKQNDADCSRDYMVTGRSSETLVVNATLTAKSGWDYDEDEDPVGAVLEFADETLKQAGKFIDGTSLVKDLPRFFFDIDEEEETAEIIEERGQAAQGFASAWAKLAKSLGDEGYFNEDMQLRVGTNIIENRYARIFIEVTEVDSFIHSMAPFTANLETDGSAFWPLKLDGKPKFDALFANRNEINFPGRLSHERFSTLQSECEKYVQGLERKGLSSKADQAYVLARMLASDALTQIAAQRCFHTLSELRNELPALANAKYARKNFVRPNDILFSNASYSRVSAQLKIEADPLAVGEAKTTPLAQEAQTALPEFYRPFNAGKTPNGLDGTIQVLDSAGVLGPEKSDIESPKDLAEAFRSAGFNRANCFFVNNTANQSALGTGYFSGDVDGVFLLHKLPPASKVSGNVYTPKLAVVAQVSINPATKKIWRVITTELDSAPLFSGKNVCESKKSKSRTFDENFTSMLSTARDLFVVQSNQPEKVAEFEVSVDDNIRIIDHSGTVLNSADALDRNVVMPREDVFSAIAAAGYNAFSCGLLRAAPEAGESDIYFAGRKALFVLHKNRFEPISDDAIIVLVDANGAGEIELLELISREELAPNKVFKGIGGCGDEAATG